MLGVGIWILGQGGFRLNKNGMVFENRVRDLRIRCLIIDFGIQGVGVRVSILGLRVWDSWCIIRCSGSMGKET